MYLSPEDHAWIRVMASRRVRYYGEAHLDAFAAAHHEVMNHYAGGGTRLSEQELRKARIRYMQETEDLLHGPQRNSGPRSVIWFQNGPKRPVIRPHRVTGGKREGRPPNGDGGIDRAVRVLIEDYGLSRSDAVKAVARGIVASKIGHITLEGARARVYAALRDDSEGT
jgi:hypothetical protein